MIHQKHSCQYLVPEVLYGKSSHFLTFHPEIFSKFLYRAESGRFLPFQLFHVLSILSFSISQVTVKSSGQCHLWIFTPVYSVLDVHHKHFSIYLNDGWCSTFCICPDSNFLCLHPCKIKQKAWLYTVLSYLPVFQHVFYVTSFFSEVISRNFWISLLATSLYKPVKFFSNYILWLNIILHYKPFKRAKNEILLEYEIHKSIRLILAISISKMWDPKYI